MGQGRRVVDYSRDSAYGIEVATLRSLERNYPITFGELCLHPLTIRALYMGTRIVFLKGHLGSMARTSRGYEILYGRHKIMLPQ